MCFIILNDFYMAHHNLLGICHQLGTGSLFVYGFQVVLGVERCALYNWKTVFAVASVINKVCQRGMGGKKPLFRRNKKGHQL